MENWVKRLRYKVCVNLSGSTTKVKDLKAIKGWIEAL